MRKPANHITTLIIGGGLSGLTVAHKLLHQNPDHKLLVIDKNDRVGGAIKSHHDQGYLAEIGPHGFLDNCEESKTILTETGLDKECVKAPLSRFVRYVCMDGKLRLIPQRPRMTELYFFSSFLTPGITPSMTSLLISPA